MAHYFWINGLTHAHVYFCSRYCAARYGISWITPSTAHVRCALCSSLYGDLP